MQRGYFGATNSFCFDSISKRSHCRLSGSVHDEQRCGLVVLCPYSFSSDGSKDGETVAEKKGAAARINPGCLRGLEEWRKGTVHYVAFVGNL